MIHISEGWAMSLATFKKVVVLRGKISDVVVKNTTAEIFFSAGDREGMAATGALAAATGLSGAAAGMVAMSMDEMSEPVSKISFEIDGKKVEALLAAWPFNEGDVLDVVAEESIPGAYTGFSVSDPVNRIIALYPHVSAGSVAHWIKVVKYSALFSVAFVSVVCSIMVGLAYLAGLRGEAMSNVLVSMPVIWGLSVSIFFIIGCRMGRRFAPFTRMAEIIFSSLELKGVKRLDLRRITKSSRRPGDSPALGDSYFRF